MTDAPDDTPASPTVHDTQTRPPSRWAASVRDWALARLATAKTIPRNRWIALGVIGALAITGSVIRTQRTPTKLGETSASASTTPSASTSVRPAPSFTITLPELPTAEMGEARAKPLSGLDLKVLHTGDSEVTATYRDRVAHLTLQPKLQNFVTKMLGKHKIAEGAIVMMEPATGKIIAYASHSKDGRDVNVDSFAPSASVFKIVTGSTLVQVAGLSPDTKTCYFGGEQRITERELKEDPKRDTYCATLAQAMGRSLNAVFAKLALKKLTPTELQTIASQFGYGETIPFDVPIEPSKLEIPTDSLGFARTAAGFWNTSLSPVHGALLAATIANGGNMPRPWLVHDVTIGNSTVYRAPAPSMFRTKVVSGATANSVTKMMMETVSQGTSFKAFHDRKGRAFLPDIDVAGKTGTLNSQNPTHLFTWFVGFAPADNPQVAIAALVVNNPVWEVKANVLARKALMAYFHLQGNADVTMPDE